MEPLPPVIEPVSDSCSRSHVSMPPVGALDVRAVRVLEHEPAADSRRPPESANARTSMPQRVGRPRRVRVRERHDVGTSTARLRGSARPPCRRAGTRAARRAARAPRSRGRSRACGPWRRRRRRRSRQRPPGSRARRRFSMRRAITSSSLWAATMIVTRGQDVLAPHRPRRDPRGDGGGGRIADVGPRERRQAAPEDLPHQASTISRSSSR